MALACETSLSNILATLAEGRPPDLVVVNSIQTLWADGIEAAAGMVSQVRAATQSLVRFAKAQGPALLLVGHVTKDGQIAGPKVIEHMVDTVLYFEGDRGHSFRILRATKNRFGATDEIGVFEMSPSGLREVANPSELFLGERLAASAGSAVFAGMEGTRPILVELQALVVPSGLGTPRRAVVGWDANRLAMLLAVLDARSGISFAQHDVYLNVAGGLKITEPAADLAAAAALLSSISNVALGPHEVYFGEISLSGAVRPAGHMASRLKEARKLGFKRAVLPAAGDLDDAASKLDLFRLGPMSRDWPMTLGTVEMVRGGASTGRRLLHAGQRRTDSRAGRARPDACPSLHVRVPSRGVASRVIAGFYSLDLALVAVVAISGLVAMYRGFTREVLSILSWLAAAAAAFYVIIYHRGLAERAGQACSPTPRSRCT